jgi:hypothetical protein
MSVIAALNDPLAVLLTHDLSNVMTPNNDRPNVGATGIGPVACPRTREIVGGAGITADL